MFFYSQIMPFYEFLTQSFEFILLHHSFSELLHIYYFLFGLHPFQDPTLPRPQPEASLWVHTPHEQQLVVGTTGTLTQATLYVDSCRMGKLHHTLWWWWVFYTPATLFIAPGYLSIYHTAPGYLPSPLAVGCIRDVSNPFVLHVLYTNFEASD